MKRLTFLLMPCMILLATYPISGINKLAANTFNDFQANLVDSVEHLSDGITVVASDEELNKTYIASNAVLMFKGDLKDNIPTKIKSEQLKVEPSSGSYQGGCNDDDYYIEISGPSFGNGWDISSVTICGVEVCHIIMQSSNFVAVHPNPGTPGTGDIVITSESKGKTTIGNGFTYLVKTPENQATNIQFLNAGSNSADISWTRGSGESCIVFMKEADAGSITPTDRITYDSGIVFGDGTQIDSTGWYCIYNGNGSSVSVSGLKPGASYIAQVFEYNGTGGYETYLNSTSNDNPKFQAATSNENNNSKAFNPNTPIMMGNAKNNQAESQSNK